MFLLQPVQAPIAQIGVVPEQSDDATQPTQIPPAMLQMGVAGVPIQSVDAEQPQVPDVNEHTGVVPVQVVTLSHPVRAALQICDTLTKH